MGDYLLQLSRNRTAKQMIKKLGLPIPLPTPLKRGDGPWSDELLGGKTFVVDDEPKSKLSGIIAEIIGSLGGTAAVNGDTGSGRPDGLIIDASYMTKPADLEHIYNFLHPRLRALNSCGRVIIIGKQPDDISNPDAVAVQEGLKGLVKSLGKEVGKRGSTTHLIYVGKDATEKKHLAATLAFTLSPRSAFISGQVYSLSSQVAVPDTLIMNQSLSGKTALVTGAAQGIGRSIAERLAEEGAKVICLDRDSEAEKLEQVANEIGGIALPMDLLADGAADKIRDAIKDQCGSLDIVVNNAGITRDKTLSNMSKEWWSQTIDVNLKASIELTDSLSDSILNENGRIICMSSIAGIAGNMGQTNYATAKAGLIGFVRSKSKKLAKKNITINAIAPGFIETRMTKAIPMAVREVARRFNALSQAGHPDDIGETVVFLVSQGAAPLTGQCIRVCGLNLIGA